MLCLYVHCIGFIYVGTFLHQFIHLTQYIAPLQADFNPGLNETATVLIYNAGEIILIVAMCSLRNNLIIVRPTLSHH